MKKYAHVIFDLDHTLWDFTANSNETLKELYKKYNMENLDIELGAFLDHYQEVNDTMWFDYNRGRITKEDIRDKRFKITLSKVGVIDDELAYVLNEDYLLLCPAKGFLVPFALDILDYLKDKYHLHILTNGFQETQSIKLETSGLVPFFKEVVNSEISGFLKPDKRIFDYTLKKINAECQDCIMIGDDLHADVLGAKNAGIDHVYFNRKNLLHEELITHEIKCLSELKLLL